MQMADCFELLVTNKQPQCHFETASSYLLQKQPQKHIQTNKQTNTSLITKFCGKFPSTHRRVKRDTSVVLDSRLIIE